MWLCRAHIYKLGLVNSRDGGSTEFFNFFFCSLCTITLCKLQKGIAAVQLALVLDEIWRTLGERRHEMISVISGR